MILCHRPFLALKTQATQMLYQRAGASRFWAGQLWEGRRRLLLSVIGFKTSKPKF
jgi:hypothetical protein